jgi:hypothetical protein
VIFGSDVGGIHSPVPDGVINEMLVGPVGPVGPTKPGKPVGPVAPV